MGHRIAPNRFPLGYINKLNIERIVTVLQYKEDEHMSLGSIYLPGPNEVLRDQVKSTADTCYTSGKKFAIVRVA